MTDWVTWFRERLRSSGEDYMWAFEQILAERHNSVGPNTDFFGLWEPARLVWHVTEYERCIALPTMKQWLGGDALKDGDDSIWPDNDEAWALANQTDADYVQAFWDVRNQQIALLDSLTAVNWSETRPTIWGGKPLTLVVTKTFQHTLEHGSVLLRMAMWWDDVLAEVDQEAEAG